MPVDDGGDSPGGIEFDVMHEGLAAYLRARGDGQRKPGDVHGGFGSVATTLVTVAAVDAGVALAVRVPGMGERGYRSFTGTYAERFTTALHDLRGRVERDRRQRVSAGRIPWVRGGTGDADEAFDGFIVRQQIGVGERPVGADTELSVEAQVSRVGTRHEGSPVQRGAADAGAGIVGAKGFGRFAVAEPFAQPVQIGGGKLVGGEVGGRRPVATGFESDDAQAGLRQARE